MHHRQQQRDEGSGYNPPPAYIPSASRSPPMNGINSHPMFDGPCGQYRTVSQPDMRPLKQKQQPLSLPLDRSRSIDERQKNQFHLLNNFDDTMSMVKTESTSTGTCPTTNRTVRRYPQLGPNPLDTVELRAKEVLWPIFGCCVPTPDDVYEHREF
eukprot:GHVO01011761.1.p1 GENE.GHVO01011761.1~~GHVO01011761.1.p1  ORF type:complete len:155 (+),score=11.85 GHVO01011761.1:107-571(+)